MKKEKLVNRVKNLYRLEFLNIFLLPLILYYATIQYNQSIGVNSVSSIILNGILLIEGSFFWFNVYRNLTQNQDISFVRYFKIFKPVNMILIALTLVIIVFNNFKGIIDIIGTFSFLLLAILEHINYFEFQLMYDNKNDLEYLRLNKRLKISKLKILMNDYYKRTNSTNTL